jgi:very-short-patch-repair endonuclease
MPPRTSLNTQSFAGTLRRAPTEAERAHWQHLERDQVDGIRFRRQVPIGPYIADFACLRPRIVIELDGSRHGDATSYDAVRAAYLQKHGFRVLRFWDIELFTQRQAVLDTIWIAVDAARMRTSSS